MRFDDVAARLRSLPSPLPEPTHRLTPRWDGRRPPPRIDDAGLGSAAYKASAVLVLIFPDESGEARVLLTARPERDIRHAGQVSFPGGATDPGDVDATATAVREAREEVGLDPAVDPLEFVGILDPVTIPVSGFRLVPVLALATRRPRVRPDPREVRAVFDAPIDRFLPSAPIEEFQQEISPGLRIRYAAFDFEGHHIWGATARVLGQLGAVLGT